MNQLIVDVVGFDSLLDSPSGGVVNRSLAPIYRKVTRSGESGAFCLDRNSIITAANGTFLSTAKGYWEPIGPIPLGVYSLRGMRDTLRQIRAAVVFSVPCKPYPVRPAP